MPRLLIRTHLWSRFSPHEQIDHFVFYFASGGLSGSAMARAKYGDWGNPLWLGFQFGGPGVDATIKIDDLQIWGNVEVEDAQPILVQNFDTVESVDTFAFDYASGLDESSLAANNAKFWGVSTLPFGWIANSWIGSEGFDMCYSESAVDLTPCGDEIVNGAKGIAETSIKANF